MKRCISLLLAALVIFSAFTGCDSSITGTTTSSVVSYTAYESGTTGEDSLSNGDSTVASGEVVGSTVSGSASGTVASTGTLGITTHTNSGLTVTSGKVIGSDDCLKADGGEGFAAYFVDVGQGDCSVVICDGSVLLIDGGTSKNSSRVVAVLKKLNVTRVDTIICTHAHEDHCGGLAGSLNVYETETVYAPLETANTKTYKNFVKAVQAQDIEITHPVADEMFYVGSALVTFLSPTKTDDFSDLNNTSLMFIIEYGGYRLLFTGDAERELEASVLESGVALKADVLKVGHHGSNSSTTYPFLREIMPEYAIISVGKNNSYDHPSEDTLSRLSDADVNVLRTDLLGDIAVTIKSE